jgi:hypothetical protein
MLKIKADFEAMFAKEIFKMLSMRQILSVMKLSLNARRHPGGTNQFPNFTEKRQDGEKPSFMHL